jgi:hypothetical protein
MKCFSEWVSKILSEGHLSEGVLGEGFLVDDIIGCL